MPWSKKQNSPDCPSDKPVAVVNDDTDEVMGCHADDESADAQIAALNANVDEEAANDQEVLAEQLGDLPAPDGVPAGGDAGGDHEVIETATDNSFTVPVMVIEGAWTGDRRFIDPGVLSWRDLPLPLMAITKTTYGHDDAELSGKLDVVVRKDANEEGLIDPRTGEAYNEGTTFLAADGMFDTSEWAAEIKRLVSGGFLRGVSVDMGDVTSDIVFIDSDGNEVEDVDFFDWLFGPEPDEEASEDGDSAIDYNSLELGEKIRAGRVMGLTACPFPAFEGAYIAIPDGLVAGGFMLTPAFDNTTTERWPSITVVDKPGTRQPSLVASSSYPAVPPSKWFHNPEFSEETALTIDSDGHIYGHMASWTECHTAFSGQCIMAPRSATDYAYYRTGAVLCDDDILVATGPITMGTGHAELWQDANAARAHYDNTGTAVADVVCGEDEFGIWFSGAMSPDADEISVRRLRASALSGDWRTRGGNLELIASLAVNSPGFPVKRPMVRVASGWPQAMVAAGMVTARTIARKPISVASHRVANDAAARAALRSKIHPE